MTKRRLLLLGTTLYGAWFATRRRARQGIKTVTFGPTTMITRDHE